MKFHIDKIKGRYLLLEPLLYLDDQEIFAFLHSISMKGREYMIEMHKYILDRAIRVKEVK